MKTLLFLIVLKWQIFKAKQYHRHTNKQYYVLKWYGWPRVFSTSKIKSMRSQRTLNKSFDFIKLNETALYVTPNSLGQKPKLGKQKNDHPSRY